MVSATAAPRASTFLALLVGILAMEVLTVATAWRLPPPMLTTTRRRVLETVTRRMVPSLLGNDNDGLPCTTTILRGGAASLEGDEDEEDDDGDNDGDDGEDAAKENSPALPVDQEEEKVVQEPTETAQTHNAEENFDQAEEVQGDEEENKEAVQTVDETTETTQPPPTEDGDELEQPTPVDDSTLEDDSSANIDRMDYADAYDEEDAEAAVESALHRRSNHKIALADSITPDMRDTLVKQLKFRRSEVKRLRPDIAAIVVAKQLQRPQEGLPPHWLMTKASRSDAARGGLTKKSLVLSFFAIAVAALGGAAWKASTNWVASDDVYDFEWTPPTSSSPLSSSMSSSVAAATDVPEQSGEEEDKESSPVSSVPKDDFLAPPHEHSLRPGEHPPSEPIDETWLDKFLTRVEKGLAKLFGR